MEQVDIRSLKTMFKLAPISINCQLGDPFQKTQWEGTQKRLLELSASRHQGPVALITKSIVTDEQIWWLNTYTRDLNLIVYFSITGLDERYPLATTLEGFKRFSRDCHARAIVFIRPIIPGRNDKISVLRPIIETASDWSARGAVIFRGYKDIENDFQNVTLDEKFVEAFMWLCKANRVTVVGKSRDIPSMLAIHSLTQLPAMSEDMANSFFKLIGFDDSFKAEGSTIKVIRKDVSGITRGDIHFMEMFTKLPVEKPKDPYRHNFALLSKPLFGKTNIDATSSWLGWGENKPCMIGCPYCIATNEEQKTYKHFGANLDTIIDEWEYKQRKDNEESKEV